MLTGVETPFEILEFKFSIALIGLSSTLYFGEFFSNIIQETLYGSDFNARMRDVMTPNFRTDEEKCGSSLYKKIKY
uniref:Uncharacterized protein n=1 Tax=Romanomermis culicivorax TaxID=13658 RepID=A0A915ICM7_ROMCU